MTGEGTRARKRRRTYDGIERAALELFAQRGFAATSIRDIAERAGVGTRTVLRYFDAKRDLVFEASAADLEVLLGHLADGDAGGSPAHALAAALVPFADHLDADLTAQRARAVAGDEALSPWASHVRDDWARRVAGELCRSRPGLSVDDATLLASSALLALEQAVISWSRQEDPRGALRDGVSARIGAWQAMLGERA